MNFRIAMNRFYCIGYTICAPLWKVIDQDSEGCRSS
ncbi:hypothetical protein ME1_00491 [Bartonella vinsonii subsp. arupensis OK-94-513]|uniref:Uncharacterized protein n=2 Tax=Bartonella vinsonii subsp. arupensis TaxID=110578 RepID=J0QUT8_BARVI|nr:hypothetical protein ME1_00491 [Bartonella vinsonii subsp. arupensis OK-94-513]EJF98376.1 hypothetical protein MEI_00875 [Bartonella vinsonii subsp. arupensis Pm136co]